MLEGCVVGDCGVTVVHMVQNRKKNKSGWEVGIIFKVPSLVSYFYQPGPISLIIGSTAPKIAPFKAGAHGGI